jgi:hypothetical protein
MKVILTLIILFYSLILLGQKKKNPVPPAPVITIMPVNDTIEALMPNDIGIRTLVFKVSVTPTQQPVESDFKIELIDPGTKSGPSLIGSVAHILKSPTQVDPNDATVWYQNAYCNVVLQKATDKIEAFYIQKALDTKSVTKNLITVVIKPGRINAIPPSPTKLDEDLQVPASDNTNGSLPTPKKTSSHVHLDDSTTVIFPIYNKDSTRDEKIIVKLSRDSIPVEKKDTDKIVYSIEKYSFPFTPKIISVNNFSIPGPDKAWNITVEGSERKIWYKDTITIQNQTIKDTLTRDLSATLRLAGDSKTYHEISLSKSDLFPKLSSYALISLVKSISGRTAASDLFDAFFKTNIVSKEKFARTHHISFVMIGVDASLDTSTLPIRLNEATVLGNFGVNPVHPATNVLWFFGGGLKVFNYNAFLGGHTGMELLSGTFKESYILAGWYYSPWLGGVKPTSTDTTYRNNIYLEAAINAFGDNVPKTWQSLRLKFGFMLPMAFGRTKNGVLIGDTVPPTKNDFVYRLAIEVPLGGLIKLF